MENILGVINVIIFVPKKKHMIKEHKLYGSMVKILNMQYAVFFSSKL